MKAKQPAGFSMFQKRPAQTALFPPAASRLLLAAFVFWAASASAANLTWDAGNTNNGGSIDAASGAWDTDTTTNINWNSGTGNVSWTQTSITAGLNGTIFAGADAADGTYQIALDGVNVAYTNLTVSANGYVFNGPASMFMNTSGTLLVNDGKSVTFNNNFGQNNSAKFWQLGTASTPAFMTVLGNIAGDQIVFNCTNGGAFYLGGNTAASVTTIDATVWQTNGTSTGANTWQVGRSVVGSLNNSAGRFILDGPGTVMTFTTSLQMSRGGGNGTVNVQNGATMNVGTTVSAAQNVQIESELANNSHAAFRMYGGTLNIGQVGSGTAIGTIWLNKSGSNPGSTAEFTQTGGVVNAWGGLLIGATSGTFSGGTAAVTNSGGFLYIGSGGSVGISYGSGGHAPTNYVTLSGGTVGALANWNSTVPMTLGTAGGNITFQCADGSSSPWNIALSGALTGPGGLYKSGSGTLTLSGANNYVGSTVVSNGTLKLIPSLLPTNGAVTLDGSAGLPVNTVSVTSPGQQWTLTGDLTYAAGTMTADFNYNNFPPSTTVAPVQTSGNVNFTVAPQVTIEGGSIPAGTYPLIRYGGSVSGALPTVASWPSPFGYAGYLSNSVPNKTIYLVMTSSPVTASYVWSVGSGRWDFTTKNWKQFGGPLTNYLDPDAVQFDDIAPGPFPITVTNNTTVSPAAIAVLGTNAYILSGNGAIAGSASLTKSGNGALTLLGTNTYSGGTTIQAGQLNINYGGDGLLNSAIGTGPLTNFLGAVIDNTSGQPVTLLTPILQYWNDDWTFLGSTNFNTGPGAVTLGSGIVALTVVSNILEVDGSISESSSGDKLQKFGGGTLTLRTDNFFTGGLDLFGGLLNFGSGNSAGNGILTIDGGSIYNVSGSDLTLNGITAVSIPIATGGTLTFLGTGNLDIPVQINPNNGGTMFWNVVSNTLTTEGDIVSGNTTLIKQGQGRWVLSGFGTANQSCITVDGGELDLDRSGNPAIGPGGAGPIGSHGLVVESNSLVIITGPTGNQISQGNYVPVILDTGGVLDMNGQSEAIDVMSITNGILRDGASGSTSTLTITGTIGVHPTNAITLNGPNGQFDVPPVDATLIIAATINGGGSLVKTGLGTLTLQNSNNYTGNITVIDGTLSLSFPDMTNSAVVTIATNSVLGTNAVLNLNFANGETNAIAALVVGGVSKAAGIYNSTTDPLYITGSGSLQVIPPVLINPLPGTIQFNVSGSTLALSWPTNLGWILQNQTNALSTGLTVNSNQWFDIPNSASVTATNISINPTNPTVFFRLRHP